eukprot:3706014-Rhodomonas_salina.1
MEAHSSQTTERCPSCPSTAFSGCFAWYHHTQTQCRTWPSTARGLARYPTSVPDMAWPGTLRPYRTWPSQIPYVSTGHGIGA